MAQSAESKSDYKGYTFGHTKTTTASHASRTIYSDAAFLLPYIQPHHSILDVGCGPGTITIGFAGLVPDGKVTAVDISEVVLEQAKGTFAQAEETLRSRVSCVQADIITKGLPFPDNEFDIIYASQLFSHFPPPDIPLIALREMKRVLKPGGILATRDAAAVLFYPFKLEFERLWFRNVWKGVKTDDFIGPLMGRFFRALGWNIDADEADEHNKAEGSQGRIIMTTSTSNTVVNLQNRRAYADLYTPRLVEGEPFRKSWEDAGVSVKEIQECVDLWEAWVATEDAIVTTVQCNYLAWK
jgi:ubiquinone/menaquinone biosynthesis C-methylase UbiE